MRNLDIHRVAGLAAFLILTLGLALSAGAYPTLYQNRCASCHSDDSPSCDGCHQHHGPLSASADHPTYDPGAIVTVTLGGGQEGGWVRGLLFDQDGIEVDRQGGPTGTGDDGQGGAVTFPVTLQASAPTVPGDYTWQAAWFGGVTSGGGAHTTDSVEVSFTVTATSAVPEEPAPGNSWDRIKALYR